MTNEPNNPHLLDEPLARDDADLLISRAVDGRTSQAEWVLLELAAAQDPGVWRRLAQAHRDQSLLAKGVARATDLADGVELPSRLEAERDIADNSFFRGVRSWGGWAAAAALTMAVVVQTNNQVTPSGESGPTRPAVAGIGGSAADAWNTYLDRGRAEGRVVGEVPDQVLVDSRPVENGQGFDVVYVRQVVERARVADLYRFSHDEAGRATPVRVRARTPQESQPTVY